MSGRGVIALLAAVLLGGVSWADPPAATPRVQLQLDVLAARLKPEAWEALKGALSRSTVPAALKGDAKATFAGVLRPEQDGISAILKKMEKQGLAKILSSQSIAGASGQPCDFATNGPRPESPRSVAGSPAYLDVGIPFHLRPTVLGNGRIRLEIEPYPGSSLETRKYARIQAAAEMWAGQTFVLGGVSRHGTITDRECVPALRGVPYLRHLFSHEATRESDYELLVLVTPRVAAPAAGNP